MTQGFGDNIVVQVGLVVKDIEKSIDSYVSVFGLQERPQAQETDGVEKSKMRYHGEPSEARAKLAFVKMGQVTIELIEPIGGPSTWQEFLDAHGEGVHHIAFMVKGTDQVVASLNSRGIPMAQRGDYTGGQYTYMDSAPQLGVILELLENF
jgi:catechol 2,3-dioxygenase-like lactoylglutathione lyase family enzyme